MEDQLWALFRETGDPMGYLLYRAEKNSGQKKTADKAKKETPGENAPAASA